MTAEVANSLADITGPSPVEALATRAGKLPLTTRLLYGLGSVAFGVKDNGFSFLLLLFYNQVVACRRPWWGSRSCWS
jgi:hypothetical protein